MCPPFFSTAGLSKHPTAGKISSPISFTFWSNLLKNEHLNSIDPVTIQNYLNEGPFTHGFSQESSPGNLGQWIGRQIVKKFAEKNSDLTPQAIMRTNARKILEEAKYKPR